MSALNSFLAALAKLFGLAGPQPAPPQPPPSTPPPQPQPPTPTPVPGPIPAGPLQPMSPRVLVVVYDPVVNPATGAKLLEWAKVNRNPPWSDVQDLIDGYIQDVHDCSGGLVNYQVVERVDVNEFPVKADGFRYDAPTFLNVLNHPETHHEPDLVDYQKILSDFNILARVASGEIDEVWLFAFPFAGFYESHMGGKGAFWCNSNPIENTDQCPRRFVVMGFNYERGVGEMLEDLGHRAESMLGRVFGMLDLVQWAYNAQRDPNAFDPVKLAGSNLWARFICYDQIAPGKSNVGLLHFAPNSVRDYDWNNPRPVLSCCDDWLSFPALPNPPNYRTVTAADWGGEIRAHHRWWLQRLPKVEGALNGIANNWWQYFIRCDNPFFDR